MGCPHQTLERSLECAGRAKRRRRFGLEFRLQTADYLERSAAKGGTPNNPERCSVTLARERQRYVAR